MALYSAEREHRLKAAAIMHNRILIVVHCRGWSAVIYLLN